MRIKIRNRWLFQSKEENRHACYNFASTAWEILNCLPTNPEYKRKLDQIMDKVRLRLAKYLTVRPVFRKQMFQNADENSDCESDVGWAEFFDGSRKHCIHYALQMVFAMLARPDARLKVLDILFYDLNLALKICCFQFSQLGGVKHLLKILLSQALVPEKTEEWSQVMSIVYLRQGEKLKEADFQLDLDCLTLLIRAIWVAATKQMTDDEKPSTSRSPTSQRQSPDFYYMVDTVRKHLFFMVRMGDDLCIFYRKCSAYPRPTW